MKKKRHSLILKLIETKAISTQEELLLLLCESGFDVTQATVSRDIKELKLVKTSDSSGKYSYSLPTESKAEAGKNRFNAILSSSIKSVQYACNMVCVLCNSGMAQAACLAIDELKCEYIIGTLAGEDTIFAMCKSEENAQKVSEMINNMLNAE